MVQKNRNKINVQYECKQINTCKKQMSFFRLTTLLVDASCAHIYNVLHIQIKTIATYIVFLPIGYRLLSNTELLRHQGNHILVKSVYPK